MWFDLHAIPSSDPKGRIQEGNDTETFKQLQSADFNINNIWTAGVIVSGGVGAILSIGGSILSKSWAPFTVYLFGMIFWASYTKSLIYFATFGVPSAVYGLFTIPIALLFVGAAAGIFGGQS
jgi:hypothetical protein